MEQMFPASAEALSDVRAFVAQIAKSVGAREEQQRDLVLAVSEACANAVTHANTATIHVRTRIVSDRLTVLVRDEGLFLWGARAEGGYGIPMMVTLTDELNIDEGSPERPGTEVKLVKRVASWRERVELRTALVGQNRDRVEQVSKLCQQLRRAASGPGHLSGLVAPTE